GTASGDRLTARPSRRVGGIDAVGLRVTPADPHTTVAYADIWASPATGLPLQVEVVGKSSRTPVLVTRFLEIDLRTPAANVLDPSTMDSNVGFSVTETPDIVGAFD